MRQTTNRLSFTQSTVAKIPVPATGRSITYDSKTPGLGVMTQCTGRKTYFWFRRVSGERKWITLGFFPELSVTGARDAATKHNSDLGTWRSKKYDGPSPFDEDSDVTLGRLLNRYLKDRF